MKRLQNAIQYQTIAVKHDAEQLKALGESLTGTLAGVNEKLEKKEYDCINPLGELQRAAQEFDRLCSTLTLRHSVLKDLQMIGDD